MKIKLHINYLLRCDSPTEENWMGIIRDILNSLEVEYEEELFTEEINPISDGLNIVIAIIPPINLEYFQKEIELNRLLLRTAEKSDTTFLVLNNTQPFEPPIPTDRIDERQEILTALMNNPRIEYFIHSETLQFLNAEGRPLSQVISEMIASREDEIPVLPTS